MLVNLGQINMLWNFACSCEARGIDWRQFTLVYALDSGAGRQLDLMGVQWIGLDGVELSQAAAHFSDSTFGEAVFWKTAVRSICMYLQQ